jgi:hypothetical protein
MILVKKRTQSEQEMKEAQKPGNNMSMLRRANSPSFEGRRAKLRGEELTTKTMQPREFSEQGKVKWSSKGPIDHFIRIVVTAYVEFAKAILSP